MAKSVDPQLQCITVVIAIALLSLKSWDDQWHIGKVHNAQCMTLSRRSCNYHPHNIQRLLVAEVVLAALLTNSAILTFLLEPWFPNMGKARIML